MTPQTISFYFAIITVFVAVSLAGDGEPGVTIAGNYTLVTVIHDWKHSYGKYLAEIGVPDYVRKKIQGTKSKEIHVQIKELKGNKYQVIRDLKWLKLQMDFESGKEFEAETVDGRKLKNLIMVDQKAKTAKVLITVDPGVQAIQDVKFSKGGFNVTMQYRDVVAMLEFSRDKK